MATSLLKSQIRIASYWKVELELTGRMISYIDTVVGYRVDLLKVEELCPRVCVRACVRVAHVSASRNLKVPWKVARSFIC